MNFVLDLCRFRSCCECGAEHVQSRTLRARCPIGAGASTRPPAWTCRFLKIERNNSVCGVGSNRKGCDIGYGLAANSCEGVNSVDACTVTALDAITAFAVPNPDGTSQDSRFFRVWCPAGHPARLITQPTSDWQLLEANPFSRRRW